MSDLNSKQEIAPAITKTPEERIKLLVVTVKMQNETILAYEAAFAEAEEKGAQFDAQNVKIAILKKELKLERKRIKNIFKFMEMVGVDQTFLVKISKIAFSITKKGKAYFPKNTKLETWKN